MQRWEYQMSKFFVIIFVIPLMLTSCGDVEDTDEYQQGREDGFYEGVDWACNKWKWSLPSQVYDKYKPKDCR